jgi:D-tyrosyl-tRNA(Tyr) deacylase
MRAVVQRVTAAEVQVAGAVVGAISQGMVVLLGIGQGDTHKQVELIGNKILDVRIFDDDSGKPNVSLRDTGYQVLVVSQFTLYADISRGRRPGYSHAAPPDHAAPLVEAMVAHLRNQGLTVATGVFGAEMQVSLTNDGPYTLIIDSDTLGYAAGMHP